MKCLIAFVLAAMASAAPITVTLNTSPLIGGQYSVVFDLVNGDATANNTAVINSVNLGGGTLVGSPVLSGGVSGGLANAVTLTDAAFFNEYLHEFIPGSLLSFAVDSSTNFAGGTPDSLTFLLIDTNTGLPIPTLVPLGTDVFVAIDLDSPAPLVQTFATDPARTNVSIAEPIVTSQVHEPGSALLIGAGVLLLAWRRRHVPRC